MNHHDATDIEIESTNTCCESDYVEDRLDRQSSLGASTQIKM